MASALDGTTILDLTEGPAGALATLLLCDHGARVIRVVDRHATAPRRGGYLVWDRGKECIHVDLSRIEAPSQSSRPLATTVQGTPESPTEVYARLIRSTDVLVEDFPPGHSRQNLVHADSLFARPSASHALRAGSVRERRLVRHRRSTNRGDRPEICTP